MSATLLKHTAKVVIVSGAVYATFDKGMWESGTGQGSRFLEEVKKNILPETVQYLEKAPTVSSLGSSVATKWNTGVKKVFSAAFHLPEMTGRLYAQIKDKLSSLIE